MGASVFYSFSDYAKYSIYRRGISLMVKQSATDT